MNLISLLAKRIGAALAALGLTAGGVVTGLAVGQPDPRMIILLLIVFFLVIVALVAGCVIIALAFLRKFDSQVGNLVARTYEIGVLKAIRPKQPPPPNDSAPPEKS